jgi:hypothetical protein
MYINPTQPSHISSRRIHPPFRLSFTSSVHVFIWFKSRALHVKGTASHTRWRLPLRLPLVSTIAHHSVYITCKQHYGKNAAIRSKPEKETQIKLENVLHTLHVLMQDNMRQNTRALFSKTASGHPSRPTLLVINTEQQHS